LEQQTAKVLELLLLAAASQSFELILEQRPVQILDDFSFGIGKLIGSPSAHEL
jgi:hypothetical protein